MATSTTHNSPLAVTYARSLLELANERRIAEDTGRELQGLSQMLESEPVFVEYLADPAVRAAERTASIEKIFKGHVSPLVYSFLGVMNSHGRMKLLGEVLRAFRELLDIQLGNVEVDVTTAHQLTANELEQVKSSINKALNKNAVIHLNLDENIIGGLVIRVGDQVIDASVKQQLRSMRQQLLAGATKVGH
jgi:F-type H+-transporting ATPase subunit delta